MAIKWSKCVTHCLTTTLPICFSTEVFIEGSFKYAKHYSLQLCNTIKCSRVQKNYLQPVRGPQSQKVSSLLAPIWPGNG